VSAVSNGTVTAIGKDGVVWTLRTDAETRFVVRGDSSASIDSLHPGAIVAFKGTVTDDEGDERALDADALHAWNLNDRAGKARVAGTIESVNEADGTIVVQTPRHGALEVAVDADTAIRADQHEEGAFADLLTGASVRVKGIWHSFAEVMTAVKVRIVG